MEDKNYTEANRSAWNEAASVRRRRNFNNLLQNFAKHSFSVLDETERNILRQINVSNSVVAQLCCNNGRELLAIKNMGASHCVGFDISDQFIDQARRLSQASGIECEFVRTDVYEISSKYYNMFDIVFISAGVLRWLPNLEQFFGIVAHLLKHDGILFIHEIHPILDLFVENDRRDPPPLQFSYFSDEPRVGNQGLDYYGKSTYISKPTYEFHHKLSEIINLCIRHHLVVQSFDEYPYDISSVYAEFETIKTKLPLSYALLARKSS
jgi:2-polyprenyl-3-methyl-5-hydroxy-6-metoxy-1,4-benzoquinol methylase